MQTLPMNINVTDIKKLFVKKCNAITFSLHYEKPTTNTTTILPNYYHT